MEQSIVDYLNSNKNSYTKDQLISALLQNGYAQSDIDRGISVVYGTPPGAVVNQVAANGSNMPVTDVQLPVKRVSTIDKAKVYRAVSVTSRAGILAGFAVFLVSTVFILIGTLGRGSVSGDVIGTFSARSDSANSMVAIEKAFIKPGDYEINKSVTLVKANDTYTLKILKVEVSDVSMKFVISMTHQGPGYGFLSGGTNAAKLLNGDGVEIANLNSVSSSSNEVNDLKYSAFFSSQKNVLNGYGVFSQPTVVAKSDAFTFQYPDFPKIEGIRLR